MNIIVIIENGLLYFRDGPKIAGRTSESWVPPFRGGDQDRGDREDKDQKGPGTGLFGKLRHRDQPSLPLNIPNSE